MRRALAVAVCGLLVLLGAGLSVAQAAGVPLRAGSLTAFVAADRCTTAPLAVRPGTVDNGTSQEVVLTGLPSACLGRPFALRVHGVQAALAATDTTGTLPASGTTATVRVPAYDVRAASGVALTVSTWGLRTAWSASSPGVACRVPADPSATCTATLLAGGSADWEGNYLRRFEVTTPSRTPVTWELTFDLSDGAQFPFVASAFSDVQGGLVLVSTSGCATTPRTVTVRGTTAWGSYGAVHAGRSDRLEVSGRTRGTGSLLTCP
ncbi:hypothetical protein [Cellulomonas cellasea]|uniref:IPT/TIG domain-containing protein n=1 Tax=Cellulomonas cellasea TaxID=43670 RepID=A0A7W4YDP3_9CELL|nr:hypothetical protein [Cellulomonas cellasea]MBB2925374.1 hypothetical protein [Cellulomonas cellasea]